VVFAVVVLAAMVLLSLAATFAVVSLAAALLAVLLAAVATLSIAVFATSSVEAASPSPTMPLTVCVHAVVSSLRSTQRALVEAGRPLRRY
jgi:hypothetical protein